MKISSGLELPWRLQLPSVLEIAFAPVPVGYVLNIEHIIRQGRLTLLNNYIDIHYTSTNFISTIAENLLLERGGG